MGYPQSSLNQPEKIVNSHYYYIQYGPDTIITILDPSEDMEFMGVIIKEWDFSGRRTRLMHYLNHVRKYSIILDTIPFSRYDSRCAVRDLCGNMTPKAGCDSVKIIPNIPGNSYTVKILDTLPNLPFHGLFFPDLAFLPEKIYDVGFGNETMTLDKVLYGKTAVDSILDSFSVVGYELITENDLSLIDKCEVMDLMDEFNRKSRKINVMK